MVLDRIVSSKLSRKDFVAASGAALTALALPHWARAGLRAATAPPGTAAYVSEPGLRPPTLTVSTLNHPTPGYLFVSTLTGPGQRGPMIVDNAGNIVFFRPLDTVAINVRRQFFQGKPVLTWWEGAISKIGTGEGECVILDQTYRTIARVQAGNGYRPTSTSSC
jgi:hypothetical protein